MILNSNENGLFETEERIIVFLILSYLDDKKACEQIFDILKPYYFSLNWNRFIFKVAQEAWQSDPEEWVSGLISIRMGLEASNYIEKYPGLYEYFFNLTTIILSPVERDNITWIAEKLRDYYLANHPKVAHAEIEDTEKPNNVIAHPSAVREVLTTEQLEQEVEKLIVENPPQSRIDAVIPDLALKSNRGSRDVHTLYSAKLEEVERQEQRQETIAQIDHLLNTAKASLDLMRVLPPILARPILRLASWLNIRPECYFIGLLTAASSLHASDTELLLHQGWDFTVTPNIFGAIVAESSQKKSPIFRAMLKNPLCVLQIEENERYQEELRTYEDELRTYDALPKNQKANTPPPEPPPKPRIYFFNNATNEGIRTQAQARKGDGILALVDELAGLINSANAYRNGRGPDVEDFLSYYDGMGQVTLRASGVVSDYLKLLLAVFGTIQPAILSRLLGDCDDDNGRFARILYVNQPLAASKWTEDTGSINVTPLLADFYRKIAELPAKKYRLSREAAGYFGKIYNSVEVKRTNDPRQGMRAYWGKIPGAIGKIAINLHILHAIARNEEPAEIIQKDIIELAVDSARFFADEVEALHITNTSDTLAPHITKMIEISQRRDGEGWIKARDIVLSFSSTRRPSSTTVYDWMLEAEAIGMGTTRGSGRRLEFSAKIYPQNPPNNDNSPPNDPSDPSDPDCWRSRQQIELPLDEHPSHSDPNDPNDPENLKTSTELDFLKNQQAAGAKKINFENLDRLDHLDQNAGNQHPASDSFVGGSANNLDHLDQNLQNPPTNFEKLEQLPLPLFSQNDNELDASQMERIKKLEEPGVKVGDRVEVFKGPTGTEVKGTVKSHRGWGVVDVTLDTGRLLYCRPEEYRILGG